MSGRDDEPRAGYPHRDPRETPADLAAVQADDALLDMLGSANHTANHTANYMPGDTDRELARVLTAWRREIHADSHRVLVDTDTALAVINAARRPTRRRKPVFGTAAAAAAVLVIAFSSVGLVAKSAEPGDQLWGVTRVLYPEYSRSVEAATFVRTELKEAETAFRQGKPEQAREKLKQVQQQLPAIGEAEGRTDLTALHHDLEKMMGGLPSLSRQGSSTGSPNPGSPGSVAPEPRTSSSPDVPTPTPTPWIEPTPTPTPKVEPTPTPTPTPKVETTAPTPTPDPKVSVAPSTPKPPDTPPDDGRPSGGGAGGSFEPEPSDR